MLRAGYLLINADILPISRSGGNGDIDCIMRIEMSVEHILRILSHGKKTTDIELVAVGKLALSYCDLLRKRLKGMGRRVTILSCKQPSSLMSLSSNNHLIGVDDRYSFCTGSCKKFFIQMIKRYSLLRNTKELDLLQETRKELTIQFQMMPTHTKTGLTNIQKAVIGHKNTIDDISKAMNKMKSDNVRREDALKISTAISGLADSMNGLLTFLLSDSYEYKSIMDGAAAQLPSASKDQRESSSALKGSRVQSDVSKSFVDKIKSPQIIDEDSDDSDDDMFSPISTPSTSASGKKKSAKKSAKKSKAVSQKPPLSPVRTPSSKGTKRTKKKKQIRRKDSGDDETSDITDVTSSKPYDALGVSGDINVYPSNPDIFKSMF